MASKNNEDWITMNGTHILVDKENKTASVEKFLNKHGKSVSKNIMKKAKEEALKPDNKAMRIKKGLKKTDEISDYMESKLNNLGFKTERHYSGLSGSEYLTITNFSEMTGEESGYNGGELKIRIADHDLPPSYDGLHGYHDFDIISEGKNRGGNDGHATSYENVLKSLAGKIKTEKKEELQKIKKDKKEATKGIELPSFFDSQEALKSKLDKIPGTDASFFLAEIKNGGAWSNYKKPTFAQQKQRFKELSQKYKKEAPEAWAEIEKDLN